MPDVYISGKITGSPNFIEKFDKAAKRFRDAGYEVINPAENPLCPSWEEYMKLDIKGLVTCHTVAVLDDWKDSRGACLEVSLAKELGLDVIDAATSEIIQDAYGFPTQNLKETVLQEAHRLVNGPRQKDYGHPFDDYTCTSGMFNCYLQKKYGYNYENFKGISAADNIVLMQLVKISREANQAKRDNMVDLAGYAECLWRVRVRETENMA